MVKQRHEQWRDEQQRLLEAQTETKLAKEDDMRELARKDAQIDERIRALQIRRLRQEQQIHNEVASLTGEKRVAAKAEAQRLISSRMQTIERRLQSREETERLLALDIASSAESLRARLLSEEEVSLATLRGAAERRLQVRVRRRALRRARRRYPHALSCAHVRTHSPPSRRRRRRRLFLSLSLSPRPTQLIEAQEQELVNKWSGEDDAMESQHRAKREAWEKARLGRAATSDIADLDERIARRRMESERKMSDIAKERAARRALLESEEREWAEQTRRLATSGGAASVRSVSTQQARAVEIARAEQIAELEANELRMTELERELQARQSSAAASDLGARLQRVAAERQTDAAIMRTLIERREELV